MHLLTLSIAILGSDKSKEIYSYVVQIITKTSKQLHAYCYWWKKHIQTITIYRKTYNTLEQ